MIPFLTWNEFEKITNMSQKIFEQSNLRPFKLTQYKRSNKEN